MVGNPNKAVTDDLLINYAFKHIYIAIKMFYICHTAEELSSSYEDMSWR